MIINFTPIINDIDKTDALYSHLKKEEHREKDI
jgi:hypothetical protein